MCADGQVDLHDSLPLCLIYIHRYKFLQGQTLMLYASERYITPAQSQSSIANPTVHLL